MAWSGGTFSRANPTWVSDAGNLIGIEPVRHDAQDNDFTTGINQCLNKDGSNSATANLNLGGFLPTNIGAGTAAAPALCMNNDTNTGLFSPGADEIAVATNGTEHVRVSSTGFVAINDTPDSVFKLRVGGRLRIGKTTGDSELLWASASTPTYGAWLASIRQDIGGSNDDFKLVRLNPATGSVVNIPIQVSSSSGNIGLNTTPTTFRAQLDCTTYNKGFAINGASANIGAFVHYLDSGTQRAQTWLDVGGFATGSINSFAAIAGTTGGVYLAVGGTSWIAISDERKKKNILDLDYGLPELLQLRPVRFDYKNDEVDTSERLGFIAQEVKPLIPEIVEGREELQYGLSQTELIPILVKGIQDLNKKIEALEARIAALEA